MPRRRESLAENTKADGKLVEILANWATLNKRLTQLDEPTLERLISIEEGGRNRKYILSRLITRLYTLKKNNVLQAYGLE